MQVNERRELGFYPDTIEGPYLKPYRYDSQEGACAAKLKSDDGTEFECYYNGGPSFKNAVSLKGCEVIANFNEGSRTQCAVVKKKLALGTAFLSAVHFELEFEGETSENRYQRTLFFHQQINSCLA